MTDLQSGAWDPWAPYQPMPETPWNLRRVVHLHRRAGFAATRDELHRDLADGPGPSIDRLLEGRVRYPAGALDFEQRAALLGDAAVDSGQPGRLKAWWIFRMLAGPDPLGERLTLLWHNHFATGNQKVNDLGAMRRQNDQFRTHARSPFAELVNAAVRDPALLVWLDAPANRKGHPNENLARELMELFTLGLGHFSEGTSRMPRGRSPAGRSSTVHSMKTPPPTTRERRPCWARPRWEGSGLLRLLLDHPATAQRLANRLCELLMGEGAVDPAAVAGLADGLRRHRLDVGWGVATVLRSQAFFAASNLGTRVLGPVEFVIGAARALGCIVPMPSTLVLADWIARIGQDLFYPPNVGGWPGGRSWISSRGLIARANFATALVEGRGVGLPVPLDALGLAGAPAGMGGSITSSPRSPSFCSGINLAASGGGRSPCRPPARRSRSRKPPAARPRLSCRLPMPRPRDPQTRRREQFSCPRAVTS